MTRLGAWVVILLSAIFLLTTGGTYPGIASVEAHVIGQLIAIAVLGTWCAWAIVRPAWRPSTPLVVPIALAAAAYLASAAFSQRPRLSFEPTIAGLGWALGYVFVARLLAEGWFRARVAVVMTAFAGVVAFGYIAQVLIEWWNWWALIGRFAIPPLRPSFVALWLGSPNLIATVLMLLAPLVVAIAWGRSRRLAVALAVASALAVFLTGSRGAYLGVAVGAILALVLFAARGGGLRSAVAPLLTPVRARPVLALPFVAVGLVGLALLPSLIQRFAAGGGTLRVDLWRSALKIFADHPVFGAGPGTWVQLKVAANPEGVPNLILPHAHDMYVQAAAEVGIVGLLALAVLAIAVLRRLWMGWRSTDRALSIQTGAVLVSLAAWAAQSIVDNLVNLPMIVVILVTIVAWIDSGVPAPVSEPAHQPRWRSTFERGPLLPAAALVAFAILVPTLLRIDRAASLSRAGSSAALAGHWSDARDAYRAAMETDPGFTLYEIQTAGALARIGRTQDARDLLARAVESDPVAINVIGLASLDVRLGDDESALERIQTAIRLGPGDPTVALNAGLLAERLEQHDLALHQLATAVALDPPVISSGIWAVVATTWSVGDIVTQACTLVDDLECALIRAYAGDTGAARSELESSSPSPRRDVYLAAVAARSGDSRAAIELLEGILDKDAKDWFAAAWAARISKSGGVSSTSYTRFSKWAMAVQGDAAPSVINERAQVPAGPDAPTAALPGNYPWAVYLRPIVPYLPPDSVVLIGGS